MPDKDIYLNSGPSKPDVPKSTHDLSFTNHLTARLGRLYPVLVEEAPPNSSYRINMDMAFDMLPIVFPLQSRIRAHVSVYKVAFRNLFKNYKDWRVRVGNHVMPYIARQAGWNGPGSLAEYMDIPSHQLVELNRLGVVELERMGCFGNFTYLDPIPEGSTHDDLYLDPLANQPYSSVVVPGRYDSSYYALSTKELERPLAGLTFSLNVIHVNSLNLPSSSAQLTVYLLVKSSSLGVGDSMYEDSEFVVPIALNGYSSRQFTRVTSNLSSGHFMFGTSSSYTLSGVTQTLNETPVTFQFFERDVDMINYFINSEGFTVRLMVVYPASYASVFGSAGHVGFEPSDAPSVDYVSITSTKPDDTAIDSEVTAVTFSRLSKYCQYMAVFSGYGGDFHPFDITEDQPQPLLPINVLPFRAYEFIYNRWIRNQQVDPFIKNGVPTYNEYLTNDGDGADYTTPVDFKQMPYEFDMYTRALLSPQMGPAPLVGVTTNDDQSLGYLDMVPLVDGQPDPTQAYKIAVKLNRDDGSVLGISNYDEVADKTSVTRLTELIDFGISINDLRNVSAFHRLKERMAKAGYIYEDYEKEFYGTTPPTGEEYPEFLGGFSRDIRIGKIQNTTKSKDYALGEFAGVGGVAGESPTIKCFCAEQSYIMALMWFSVTPVYTQAIPKHFLKHHPLDYFNPQMAHIGPQPIMKHELAPLQLTAETVNDVFGYQMPWYEYRERYDTAHGLFRSQMRNYLLQRFFLDAPELTERFINIHSDELTDVFANQEDSDKFFGFIHFRMTVKNQVPKFATPRIVG